MRGAYQRQALSAVGGDIDCVACAFKRAAARVRTDSSSSTIKSFAMAGNLAAKS